MSLSDLLNSHAYLKATLSYEPREAKLSIKGISANSEALGKDYLFVAKRGATPSSRDGHDFIDQAISRGASAVVVDRTWPTRPLPLPIIYADNSSKALSFLCESFFGWPSKRLQIIGITGTNGKTSTSFMLYSILKAAKMRPAIMGTLGIGEPGQLKPLSHTTMDAEFLSQGMRKLSAEGFTHLIMEVSSHALALHRVSALTFAAVGFTNLSQDHLDFHGSMEDYRESKELLFSSLASRDTPKVLPQDHPFALEASPSLFLFDPGQELLLELPFFGDFHQKNALLAKYLAKALGFLDQDIEKGLSSCPAIPGRLELIAKKAPRVLVDFAHTPDALACALKALRPTTRGKLILVFGCGGDRDQSKRPLMGQVASALADRVFITDDNPRFENPALIRAAIVEGMSDKVPMTQIADRKEAIRKALLSAHTDDTVLIAGKGHEQYQIYGQQHFAFSDQEEARRVLDELCKV